MRKIRYDKGGEIDRQKARRGKWKEGQEEKEKKGKTHTKKTEYPETFLLSHSPQTQEGKKKNSHAQQHTTTTTKPPHTNNKKEESRTRLSDSSQSRTFLPLWLPLRKSSGLGTRGRSRSARLSPLPRPEVRARDHQRQPLTTDRDGGRGSRHRAIGR